MDQQVSIKKNFFMNAFLNASLFIFPLITFPYVSRILTPVGTGKVAFASSTISYFSMVALLGIPTYGIRACARVRENKEELSKTVHEIFFINLVMTVLSYIALFIAMFTVAKLGQEKLLLVVSSATMFFNLLGMDWLYKALEQYSYITKRSIFFKFVSLALIFVLVHKQGDYILYALTTVIASVGSNVLNFINVRKYITFKRMPSYNIKQHLKPILVFFAMSVATTIYTNLDTVMLGFMQGNEEVGYYNAAVKVKTIVVSLVTSIGTVLLPRVSYYIEKKMNQEFKAVTAKALNLVVLMALPLVIYFMVYAKLAVVFLSGDAYLNAVLPMQVIMPTVFLIGITNIMGIQILIPQGRESMVLLSEVVGAIVDLILNSILIPKCGSTGAAIGTLAAEFAVLVVQAIALRGFMRDIVKRLKLGKIILACVLGFAAAWGVARIPFGMNVLELIATGLVFFGVYGIVLLALKEPLMYESFEQVKNKIKKR